MTNRSLESPPGIALAMIANGIGDSVSGLIAVASAQRKYGSVWYHVKHDNHAWVDLFDGYDRLLPISPNVLNLNHDYGTECRTKAAIPRWRRYCNAAGVEPLVPQLRDRDGLLEAGKPYAGVVALAPFSVYNNRNYSLEGWLTVEKMLVDQGLRTVIIHNNPAMMTRFQGEKLHGRTPAFLAGVLLNAACVVGVESGICHISSMIDYGTERPKTVVLCGPTRAASVFYCPVVEAVSSVHCVGCFWQKPYNPACDRGCAALWAIDPRKVVGVVASLSMSESTTMR